MTDWQPIATAPKDGTVVRVLCNTGGKLFEATGQYLDLGAWREVGKNTGVLMPTHCKPLADETSAHGTGCRAKPQILLRTREG
jgi:hypothetical protein